MGEEMLVKDFSNGIDQEEMDFEHAEDELSDPDLPTSIIVTNLGLSIFETEHDKAFFESMFQDLDDTAVFHYFKSFRRVRITFSTPECAAQARIRTHLAEFKGSELKCYFTQPIVITNSEGGVHLEPPKREKQFLISPPASPPVGWEPREESEPVINYDLLSAVANLTPGESHELHAPKDNQPGIVVHICEEAPLTQEGPKLKIAQTRRPGSLDRET
ncbi:RRM_RCAN_like domain containing protein Sra [Oratosquilla oratoria]|uniref:RRM_RCAN_like domain containing protein Sra n=1 Tax=Oratosquilla oratoria TaxID=337810 RepID=UPI003F7742BA